MFAYVAKEKLRIKVVNEVIKRRRPTGAVFDSNIYGGFDSAYGFDGGFIVQEEVVRRQWNWKTYNELKALPTSSGAIAEGSVRIDLDLDSD